MNKQQTIGELKKQIQQVESSLESLEHAFKSKDKPVGENSDCLSACKDASGLSTEEHSGKKYTTQNALNKIVALLNASEKSTTELRKRLLQAGYSENVVEDAIVRATECGLVDDMRYARILIRSRINQGWGSAGIERELLKNNIAPDEVDGWHDEFSSTYDEEVQRGLEFLRRRPPHARNAREAAYRKLIGRGYQSSVASQAASLWYENS